jgi:hypothetical protein
LVSHAKRKTQTADAREQGAGFNIGTIKHGDTEGWRKLHNKELHNSYCSPNFVRIIKSKSMRERSGSIHGKEMHTKICWESLKEAD